jgi:aspartate 1-decarboxylase
VRRTFLNGKIHRATVTGADLNYVGSVSLDPRLMEASGIAEHEKVVVLDIDNGQRFETYAIVGDRNEVCLNGAAARLVHTGDLVIILTYADLEADEVHGHEPTVVHVDSKNEIVAVTGARG